jgi:DNA-binding response OmpR family regulator
MNPGAQPMKRILVVEDDLRLARLVKQYLELKGYLVDVEHRGDWAPARIIGEQPDLVLLDLMLPGKNGLAIAREVRSRYQGAIVLLTAHADQIPEAERCFDECLVKPVRPRLLLERIGHLLYGAAAAEQPFGLLAVETAR